jgi:hypothetical protein
VLQAQSLTQGGANDLSGLEKFQPFKPLFLPSFNKMKPARLPRFPI